MESHPGRTLLDFRRLERPAIMPPLDDAFRPAVLTNHRFQREAIERTDSVPLIFALEQAEGSITQHTTRLLPEGHPSAEDNFAYAERLLKFLLWQRGAWRVHVAGPENVFAYLRSCYTAGGRRALKDQPGRGLPLGHQVKEREPRLGRALRRSRVRLAVPLQHRRLGQQVRRPGKMHRHRQRERGRGRGRRYDVRLQRARRLRRGDGGSVGRGW